MKPSTELHFRKVTPVNSRILSNLNLPLLPLGVDKVECGAVLVVEDNLQLDLGLALGGNLLRLDVRVLVHDRERVGLGTHHPAWK